MSRNDSGIIALGLALAPISSASSQDVSEQEAYEIAKDAYLYAYPLVLMDVFMRQGTNYAEPTEIVTQAPYNQFSHARAFPPADFKAVVGRTSIRSIRARTSILGLSRSCFRWRRQTATLCYLC